MRAIRTFVLQWAKKRGSGRRWVLAILAAVAVLTGAGRLLATHQPVSHSLVTYVLLALDKIKMKNFNFAGLGDVGVNNAGGQFRFGKHSNFPDGSEVVSDVVGRIGDGSSLYLLFVNTYSPGNLSKSTIRHQPATPWTPPVLASTSPPCVSACSPGSTAVTVAKGGNATLAAGSYGSVVVGNQGVLTLTGGSYCLASLKVSRRAKVVVAGTSTINVAGSVGFNVQGTLGPDPSNFTLGASDVRLEVAGTPVNFSAKSRITALVYACNATMRFGRAASLTGQFVANQIRSDFGSRLTLQVCGDGKIDRGEQCDEGSNNGGPTSCCTADCHFKAEGTPCPDGDACDGDEVCNAIGHCLPGTPLDCRTSDPCKIGSCNPATGCVLTNEPNQTPCPDNTVCNGDEVCISGVCTDQPDPDCNDNNACTDDSCDDVNGCQHVFEQNCTPCDPEHPCPQDACNPAACVAGQCQSLPGPDCDDNNVCTHDFCDPATGCTHTSNNGLPCDDHDACTGPDTCQDSACGGFPIVCDDGEPCTNNDCDSSAGCVFVPIPGCGQGTLCTLTQGAYGAPGGIANKPTGWITQNPGVLPETVGGGGNSVTVNTQSGLIAFMPTGGTASALTPGAVVINVPGDVPDPSGSGSFGDGGGVLTGQTLALKLSVALSNIGFNPPGLDSFPLPASLCTCDGGTQGPFTISACILANASTVGDLLLLADQTLAGIDLSLIDPCLSYSEINAALDALNEGFDECRTVCSCP
ncbi:MAG: hypothetical protein HY271_17130 [Deltaproteobacteria bacterium]|nr:hypothetical protein [Deltaproteobacteria bacterium]